MPHHTISYSTIPSHTIPYHAIPYHIIPYHTTPYNTAPYHIIVHHTILYHTKPYYIESYHSRPDHATPYWPTNKSLPAHGREQRWTIQPDWTSSLSDAGGLNSRYNWDSLLDRDTTQLAIRFLLKFTAMQNRGLRYYRYKIHLRFWKIGKDSFPL